MLTALLVVSALSVSGQTDFPLDMTEYDDLDESVGNNETEELGELLGGPCKDTCSNSLIHVYCNKKTEICECRPGYPVRLDAGTGCAKPLNLGDQCLYYQTCMFNDPNSDCVQVGHKAVCDCKPGFHTASVLKSQRRSFCSEDILVIATDVPTLFGIAFGLAILAVLICFVLKLFVGSRPRHYANTNLAPPIIFAQSVTGFSTHHLSGTSSNEAGIHPPGVRVNSRTVCACLIGLVKKQSKLELGSRRTQHSLHRQRTETVKTINHWEAHLNTSVHSSTSSTKSFSARQYERERENRLLAKARERERGDGGSTSPRSLENLIDGPLPSESWPQLEEVKGKAFSPDMLDEPPDIPFPDIDQMEMDGFENPFTVGMENPLGTQAIQTHGIENPLGSLVNPNMKVGDPVRRPVRMDPLGQQVGRTGDTQAQQTLRITDPLGQQPLRLGDPLRVIRIPDPQNPRNQDPLTGNPIPELQRHGVENPLAPQSDSLNAT